jgi:hypothetical protein
MTDWKFILNRELNAAAALLESDVTAPRFKAAQNKAWELWQEAVADGFDTKNMCYGKDERQRFSNLIEGLIDGGL